MALRTDYKDDILDLTQNTKRKYRMVTNADGTVSFEDMTVYSQIGDSFGASELNEIANSVNEGGSNMYYEPATDIKYLKNQDGEWVKVGIGGLLWDGSLYREGNTYSDITGGFSLHQEAGTGGGSYSLVFNTDNITVTSNSSLGILSTNNKIDFSKFTKLHIEGTINHTGGDNVEFTVGFSTSKNTTSTSVYSLNDISGTKVISQTMDISTYNANPLYVHIKLYATYNYRWNGNFVLTNFYFLP